jgi:aspartate/glutamate racemase
MKAEDSVEAIVLAGTELPLLLRGSSLPDLDLLDAAAIHVEGIR